METRYEFDETGLLSSIAVGVPGKRTFFLVIGEKEDWLRLWLEKEQLEAIALAVDQLLATLAKDFHRYPDESEDQSDSDERPSGLPSGEFEIDQISLGFDDDKAIMEYLVHSIGPQRNDDVLVGCRTPLMRLKNFGEQAKAVCAAGRPRCELCGYPIDPEGHVCPDQN